MFRDIKFEHINASIGVGERKKKGRHWIFWVSLMNGSVHVRLSLAGCFDLLSFGSVIIFIIHSAVVAAPLNVPFEIALNSSNLSCSIKCGSKWNKFRLLFIAKLFVTFQLEYCYFRSNNEYWSNRLGRRYAKVDKRWMERFSLSFIRLHARDLSDRIAFPIFPPTSQKNTHTQSNQSVVVVNWQNTILIDNW